jgi:hypothetical protein
MGYTNDPDDLDRLATEVRRLADVLTGCTVPLNEVMAEWKTAYDVRLIELLDPLVDLRRKLLDLADEIDEHASG